MIKANYEIPAHQVAVPEVLLLYLPHVRNIRDEFLMNDGFRPTDDDQVFSKQNHARSQVIEEVLVQYGDTLTVSILLENRTISGGVPPNGLK